MARNVNEDPNLRGFQDEIKNQISQAIAAGTANADRGAGLAQNQAVNPKNIKRAIDRLDQPTMAAIASDLIRDNPEGAKNTLASRTDLSRQEIDRVVIGLGQKTEEVKIKVQQAAEQAADYSTAALWTMFASSVFALIAAILGGRMGAHYIAQKT